ncbi:DNA-binding transcriptional LysR family regulator [Saccharopolyspora phatthalungensis]|uniref:DNA-binding transcriptional LysR family regulator n=1 Tax=Saccharopolyspora phatthalungensis TaxID=664693 RepID=A0A840QBP6_9PSEU|nr:DNA-binding transcriptional LysR family regulator [Saccharopolyspora phatthalungensis]
MAQAADALYLSHSAASHRLAVLEREVGVPVAERVGRRLQLTETGHVLASSVKRLKHELDSIDALIEQAQHTVAGRVRIGLFQTAALRMFPQLLDDLGTRYPEIRLESSQMLAASALAALATGDLDVAIMPSYLRESVGLAPGLHVEDLYTDSLYLMLPVDHELADRDDPIEIAELSSEKWIAGETINLLISAYCREAGFEPDVIHRSSDYTLMTTLVSNGYGISILPVNAKLAAFLPPVALKQLNLASAHYTVLAVLRESSLSRPAVAAVMDAMRHLHA